MVGLWFVSVLCTSLWSVSVYGGIPYFFWLWSSWKKVTLFEIFLFLFLPIILQVLIFVVNDMIVQLTLKNWITQRTEEYISYDYSPCNQERWASHLFITCSHRSSESFTNVYIIFPLIRGSPCRFSVCNKRRSGLACSAEEARRRNHSELDRWVL